MADKHYDIVILGMGPVGAGAAILLARAGLKVAAIERDHEVYKMPRAVNLDGEIVRAMQPAGLAEDINALLQPVREGERVGFANSRREYMFGNKMASFGSNGWQSANMFDQPELEGFLRKTALEHPNLDAFIGFTATSFTQSDDAVTLHLQQDTTSQTVTGGYLLACDGAASATRKSLGIGWHNLGYDHDWLVVDVITKPGHTLDNTTLQVCDPDRIHTYVCTKEPFRRWEFKLNEGETWDEMLEPEKIFSLIDPWTPRGTYEIRRAAMYQFHAATADTWRVGRIFIAGDAAHQTPPFLGQGMNAGMRDVINIAWKFPMVINGVATDELLDSYQAERDAHAHDLVEWAVSIGRLMEHLAEVEAAERQHIPPPPTPPELQSAGYGQGREQPPLRAGVLIEDQVSQDGAVGHLFSQPIVSTPDGDVHLDDQLGPGFAVVGKTAQNLAMSSGSKQILDQIGATILDIEALKTVCGRFDRVFEFADAVIVRPDRYVFGHTDEQRSLDDLVSILAAKLHLI